MQRQIVQLAVEDEGVLNGERIWTEALIALDDALRPVGDVLSCFDDVV